MIRRRPILTMLLACAPLCGCGQDLGFGGRSAGSDSVLDLFAPPSQEQVIAWAADPVDPDKRQRGMLFLANAPYGGAEAFLRMYELALDDADAGVRAAATRALAFHGAPRHAPMIAQLLVRDPSELVRREAARALQRIHDPAVIPSLADAVDERREEDADVREFASIALGQYANGRGLQALISALQDRHLRVNAAALGSLRTLTGEDFGYDTGAWVRWVAETDNAFAGRREYRYPAFWRSATMAELLLPWRRPPNEVSGTPIGVPEGAPMGNREG